MVDYPSPWVTAYAIKAIKRRYNLIPLTPVKNEQRRLALANSISPALQTTTEPSSSD
jgi:hypothetical protein